MNKDNIGSYCYNVAVKRVLFSDNTAICSPNNIRRLFVSPDGVMVQYHTSAQSGLFSSELFNPSKVVDCFCDSKFNPVVTCLTELVCSNVEEIVLCTSSKNGLLLNTKELNLTSLLKGYTGALTSDVLTSLLGRFVRLRTIVLFNGLLEELSDKKIKDQLVFAMSSFVDIPNFSNRCKVLSTSNTEWYKNYRLRPQYYTLDSQNGALERVLISVKNFACDKCKEEQINRVKKDRLESKLDTIKGLNDLINSFYSCIGKSVKLYDEFGFNKDNFSSEALKLALIGVCNNQYVFGIDITKHLTGGALELLSHAKMVSTTISEEEKYDEFIKYLRSVAEKMYEVYFNWFFEGVSLDFARGQLTTRVYMCDFPKNEVFKPARTVDLTNIEADLGVVFSSEGNKVRKSLAILCNWLVKTHVTRDNEKVAYAKQLGYWLSVVSPKEDNK